MRWTRWLLYGGALVAGVMAGVLLLRVVCVSCTIKKLGIKLPSAVRVAPTGVTVKKLTNDEIAKKVFDWLNLQKNDQGVYYLFKKTDSTEPPGKDNRTGLFAVWGKYKYWKKTKDQAVYASFRQDLEMEGDHGGRVPLLQPILWDCKFMNEIASDTEIDESTRQLAQKVCILGRYHIPEIKEQGTLTEDITLGTVAKPNLIGMFGVKDKNNIYPSLEEEQKIGDEINTYAAIASDYLARNQIHSNDIYIQFANKIMELAVGRFRNLWQGRYVRGTCALGLSALDFGKYTKDTDYMNFANEVAAKGQIKESCVNGETGGGYGCQNYLSEQISCAMFFDQLGGVANRDTIIQSIVKNHFDWPGYGASRENDGSFVDLYRVAGGAVTPYKFVQDNGLMLGLLSSQ